MPRTLYLTLKRQWFDLITAGVKTEEYRLPSAWILRRLEGKTFDTVTFRNGYQRTSPVIVLEYKGWHRGPGKPEWGADPARSDYVVITLGSRLS